MPLRSGRNAAFGTAARVLFDSVQKTGALKPSERSDEQYAVQLKKLQNQSKKKGGSLGQVSYKLSDFLAATQRARNKDQSESPRRRRSTTTKPIDIPPVFTGKNDTAEKKIKAPVTIQEPTAPSSAPATTEAISTVWQEQQEKSEPHAATVVEISELKPVFDKEPAAQQSLFSAGVSKAREAHVVPPLSSVTRSTPPTETPTSAKVEVRAPLASPIFSSSVASSQVSETPAPLPVDPLSVDGWERQREQELERLHQQQAEAERQRLLAVKAEENRVRGSAWLKERTQKFPTVSVDHSAPTFAVRESTLDVEQRFAAFRKLVTGNTASPAAALAAIPSLCRAIRTAGFEKQQGLKQQLFSTIDSAKFSEDLLAAAKLHLLNGDQFAEAYEQLSPSLTGKIITDPHLQAKALQYLAQSGKWEEVLALLEKVDAAKSNTHSKSSFMERSALIGLRSVSPEARTPLMSAIERRLEESGRMCKEIKLLLASLSERRTKRAILTQLSSSPDADEHVFAQLIVSSDPSKTSTILSDMKQRGLDTDDPVVLLAQARSLVFHERPLEIFDEIQRQSRKVGVREGHLKLALRACHRTPSEEVMKAASDLMAALPSFGQRLQYACRLFPLLFEMKLYGEIVHLYETCLGSRGADIAAASSTAIAFVNDALRNSGASPVTEASVKDVKYKPQLAQASGEKGSRAAAALTSPQHGFSKDDISELTEKVLAFAKEKKWAEALAIVQALPAIHSDKAAAVTLLYNCALSASVDNIGALKTIHALMQERGVTANATTLNTLLSSLSKSAEWQEAVDLFSGASAAQKDSNTFLIYLSLLGKQGLWQQSLDVYDDMKKSNSRPTASMFTVAIGAVAPHTWAGTLRIFNDMLKIHGASVRENVINQVFNCLEQNNKKAELTKLEKEIEKKQKKKKK